MAKCSVKKYGGKKHTSHKKRSHKKRSHKKRSHKKRSHQRNRNKGGFLGIGKMLGLTKEKPVPEATPVPTAIAVPVAPAPKPTQKRLKLGLGSGMYKGEIEYGMANGQGTWTSNDGVYVIEGLWKNDKASDTKMTNTKTGKVSDYPIKLTSEPSEPSAFEQTAIASGYSQEQLANLRAKENAPVSQGGKSHKKHKKHKRRTRRITHKRK